MRLIDTDALWDKVLEHTKDGDVIHRIPPDFIDNAPTVDAEPVRHGWWIPIKIPTGVSAFGIDEMTAEYEKCSICGEQYWIGQDKKYCPNCGAKMDGSDKDAAD